MRAKLSYLCFLVKFLKLSKNTAGFLTEKSLGKIHPSYSSVYTIHPKHLLLHYFHKAMDLKAHQDPLVQIVSPKSNQVLG